MIGKYGSFIVISLLAVLACPSALASEIGEYELVATWGSLGADDGRFNDPTGIAVDGEGNVYVADTGNNRIQKFDNTGAFLLKWGTRGSGDGEFYSPQDIALDADGNVYVVDNSRIQVFDSSGTFIRKWGSYGTGEEQLQYPRSIAFDADDNAYVVAGSVIKKFDSEGNFLTAWGALGTYDGEFNNPTDVTVDGAGNVYIADCYNNRIQKFDDTGTFLLKWASQGYGEGQLQQPNGLAIDADGNIYVATWDRPVQKFDGSGSLLAKGTDTFYDSRDIVVGADGTIYVTNSRDDCVRVFKQSSAPIPTPTLTPTLTPDVVLDIVLNNSRTYSVDSRAVPRNTALAFKLTNNLNGFSNLDVAAQPAIKIDVTYPNGHVTNQFGGVDLTAIPMNGTTVYMAPINLTGVETGTYTAQARWPSTSDFYGKGLDSNTVVFEVTSGAVGITSNKDTVVRGNSFTVTITGDSGQDYFLTLQNPGAQPPTFRANQVGVTPTADVNNVTVRTTAAGTRSVELTSTTATREASYTLRVTDSRDASRYDEVRVRVETGSVTITSSGTGIYYIGEEITLSGTNTDSDTVYLFMTGPNLGTRGVHLLDALNPVVNGSAASFVNVNVEADDTWSYRWDTNGITRSLDSGGYTIYAVSAPRDKENLANVEYATRTIQLRPGSLSVQAPGTTLAQGDEYRISGIATGSLPSVNVWIFGPGYYGGANGALAVRSAAVEPDGTFECTLTGAETDALQDGRYYVVVQHPAGASFEVAQGDAQLGQNSNSIYRADQTGVPNVFVASLTVLQPAEAVNALIDALESPFVDDIYIRFSFTIDECWIWIDGVADQTYGETFAVTGMTNYPSGTVLDYWVATEDDNTFVLSGEAAVTDAGDWSIDLDTTTIGPGAFILRLTAPDGRASATTVFDIYDDLTHPVPPGGGSYRVERIDINSSLGDLSPGEGVALDGVIGVDDTIGLPYPPLGYGYLEFSTGLVDPAWSYSIQAGDQKFSIGPMTMNSRSLVLSGRDLDYGMDDVRILLQLSGTVPQGTEDPVLLRILERDGSGRVVPNSEHLLLLPLTGDDPAPPFTDNLTLSSGWNFVSVPRALSPGDDTATIFAAVDTEGHSAFRYDTVNRNWIALQETDQIRPLEGYWIYSTGPATVPLTFSTDPLVSPPERTLSTGWNAVGVTGTAPATARDALYSVNAQWTTLIGFNAQTQGFETGIVNGGTGGNADTRSVYPGRGYWLYMTGPGTLCALGV